MCNGKMPGTGDYERFPFENVDGDPRKDDSLCVDYEQSPCRRETCSSYDQREESGCMQHGKHFVSMCSSYTKLRRDDEMEQLIADLYYARRENKKLKRENKKLRRVVHVWADFWRVNNGLN